MHATTQQGKTRERSLRRGGVAAVGRTAAGLDDICTEAARTDELGLAMSHSPTIRIDCGHGRPVSATSLFQNLPIGKPAGIAVLKTQEQASAAEKQGLLSTDPEAAVIFDTKTRGMVISCMAVCTLLGLVLVVVVTLVFVRVQSTVDRVNAVVPITDSLASSIGNIDSILNSTAKLAVSVEKLGGLTLDTSMFAKPRLEAALNLSTNTLRSIDRLASHPTLNLVG